MIDSTKQIDGATEVYDVSGLKLLQTKRYSLKEVYFEEAKNIAKVTIKYLSSSPSHKEAPFLYDWFISLHNEMFCDVWAWAGKLRHIGTFYWY